MYIFGLIVVLFEVCVFLLGGCLMEMFGMLLFLVKSCWLFFLFKRGDFCSFILVFFFMFNVFLSLGCCIGWVGIIFFGGCKCLISLYEGLVIGFFLIFIGELLFLFCIGIVVFFLGWLLLNGVGINIGVGFMVLFLVFGIFIKV